MKKLSANTTATRVQVSTMAVEIVPSEDTRRDVTIIPSASPQMFFAIDEDGDSIADCRTYQWVPMGTFPITFGLRAGQKVWAIADTNGTNPLGVICEYLDDA